MLTKVRNHRIPHLGPCISTILHPFVSILTPLPPSGVHPTTIMWHPSKAKHVHMNTGVQTKILKAYKIVTELRLFQFIVLQIHNKLYN